ncbi:MAG: 3-deoxy-manno-octulosonate cytidylyltransferase [Cyanobium sp. Prado107]|jgi:3-deoxy-manno-octulosonate cytidylyltransferase (CMP-KDO synthetase)|nr:3-deoxy-manno-octulosonate cytidylyltransferase [Cyanobium sp. Prado107]
MKVVVAVPARLESSRFPGKVLADIAGKPMLQHVLERCGSASTPDAVVLCTDSDELRLRAEDWGFDVLMTSPDCKSGSERIASVVDQLVSLGGGVLDDTLVINVQGDQPFIDPMVVDRMAEEFFARSPKSEVMTPVYRMAPERIHDPDVVKTLLSQDGRALYFSRSAIPHVRGVPLEQWYFHAPYWGHVGIYGYHARVLSGWSGLPDSPLENIEMLEQLRLIEAGIKIDTFHVENESLSVDTEAHLDIARRLASEPCGDSLAGEQGRNDIVDA